MNTPQDRRDYTRRRFLTASGRVATGSSFTLALASGASFTDAAHLANYAGGLVVMKRGTATVSASELEHAIGQD